MKQEKEFKKENFRLSLKPAPERIKEKILESARKKESRRIITPYFRNVFFASAVLILIAVVIDPDAGILKNHGLFKRLASLTIEKKIDTEVIELLSELSISGNPSLMTWSMKELRCFRFSESRNNIIEKYKILREEYNEFLF